MCEVIILEEQSALHSSQLAELPHDPADPNLREQMEEFEAECQRKVNEQLCTLEGLLHWCDHLLYQSCELYSAREKGGTPGGR